MEARYQMDNQIPRTLEEAVEFLTKNVNSEEFEQIKTKDEDEALGGTHFGIGMWMRNNWGLWSGKSELSQYFQSLGITHADDMSGIILTSWYRIITGKPVNLQEQVQYYKDYWQNHKESVD
jgi:hypothetical protein